jgi:hypothetical protein
VSYWEVRKFLGDSWFSWVIDLDLTAGSAGICVFLYTSAGSAGSFYSQRQLYFWVVRVLWALSRWSSRARVSSSDILHSRILNLILLIKKLCFTIGHFFLFFSMYSLVLVFASHFLIFIWNMIILWIEKSCSNDNRFNRFNWWLSCQQLFGGFAVNPTLCCVFSILQNLLYVVRCPGCQSYYLYGHPVNPTMFSANYLVWCDGYSINSTLCYVILRSLLYVVWLWLPSMIFYFVLCDDNQEICSVIR